MARAIAFDIDGTLTESQVLTRYRNFQSREGVITGIITARNRDQMKRFINDNNLPTDFRQPGFVKIQSLRGVSDSIEADSYIYVGNTIRDEFAATFSGWDYTPASKVQEL